MTFGQWAGRGTVIESTTDPGPRCCAVTMAHRHAWLVANGVACFIEFPNKINVFTNGHGLVETTNCVEGIDAANKRSGRNIRNASAGSNATALSSAIK